MAQTIILKDVAIDTPIAWPHRQGIADQTATTVVTAGGFGDLGSAGVGSGWYFVVLIKIKVLVGTFSCLLEMADDTAFATNKVQCGSSGVLEAGVLGCVLFDGIYDSNFASPNVRTGRYYRLVPTFGTSGTMDAQVVATQQT